MTYSVNRKTGALTTLSSMDVGSQPVAVTVAPSGKFAYLVNRNSGDVAAYAIKASSGVLQQLGSTLLGDASHILDGSNTIKR
jgi:6-phosphogluconolactonase (cycloisomerase 2 family)